MKKPISRRRLVILTASITFSLLSSCVAVHQIDRGRLAKKIMQLDPLPQQQSFVTEMHAIREGAAGGTGHSAGGGCGCN